MDKIFHEYLKLLSAMQKLISLKDANKKINMTIDSKTVVFSLPIYDSYKKVSGSVQEYIENGVPSNFKPFETSLTIQENSVVLTQRIPEYEVLNFRRTYHDFLILAQKYQHRLRSMDSFPLAS